MWREICTNKCIPLCWPDPTRAVFPGTGWKHHVPFSHQSQSQPDKSGMLLLLTMHQWENLVIKTICSFSWKGQEECSFFFLLSIFPVDVVSSQNFYREMMQKSIFATMDWMFLSLLKLMCWKLNPWCQQHWEVQPKERCLGYEGSALIKGLMLL